MWIWGWIVICKCWKNKKCSGGAGIFVLEYAGIVSMPFVRRRHASDCGVYTAVVPAPWGQSSRKCQIRRVCRPGTESAAWNRDNSQKLSVGRRVMIWKLREISIWISLSIKSTMDLSKWWRAFIAAENPIWDCGMPVSIFVSWKKRILWRISFSMSWRYGL